MSDRVVALFPESRRDWARAMVAEFGITQGLIRLLVVAWYLELRGANPMKTVLNTLSALCVAASIGVVVVWATDTSSTPAQVLLLGLGLAIQGGFTLWFANGERMAWARHLMLSGETVALLIGGGGLLATTIANIDASDPEFAPMSVAGLIAAHAMAGLYAYAIRDETASTTLLPH